jgi:hypothetical protein
MRIKFNWRHLCFNLLALWLFAHGFMILGFLNNVDAAETIRLSSNEQERLTVTSLSKLNVSTAFAYTLGQIIGVAICIVSCRFIKGAYINVIIALILLITFDLIIGNGWEILKEVFLLPGSLFTGSLYYWVNGLIMVLLGLLCLTTIQRFYSIRKGPTESRTALNTGLPKAASH